MSKIKLSCLILIIFLLFCLKSCNLDIDLFNNYWHKYDNFNTVDYHVLQKKGNEFRILLITDTQLEYSSYMKINFSAISETYALIQTDIQLYKPDLLILLGDNVGGGGFFNSIESERLIEFLDSFKIPWASVMGNHDGEGFFWSEDNNRKEMIAGIFEKGQYSLFKRGPVNLGVGNYGINIIDERGALFYCLIMMDNSRGYFNGEQIEWYQWFVTGINSNSSKYVSNLLFFHIPLPETYLLYEELKNSNPELTAEYFLESVSGRGNPNYGMFNKIIEMQSTTHLFFGHDHLNIINSDYQGVRFVYGLKTGTCNYANENRIGTTLITIQDDQDGTGNVNILIEYIFH